MVSDFYNKTLRLEKYTLGETDRSAAAAETWTATPGNLRCCLQPLNGRELQQYNKTTAEVTHLAFFDADQAIAARDRLVDGADVYEIVTVYDASGRSHHKEGLCLKRFDNGAA